MRWFARREFARASVLASTTLGIARPQGDDIAVDLAQCGWIGFLWVGEEGWYVHEGWWLLEMSGGGVAASVDCPMIDQLLRHSDLAAPADRIAIKFAIDTAARPRELRGGRAADGIAVLTADQLTRLRARGVTMAVERIADFPFVP